MSSIVGWDAVALVLDRAWSAHQLPSDITSKAAITKTLEQRAPADAPSLVNPLLDLDFIAKQYLGGGSQLSALDVVVRYATDLLPRGLAPHPLIDRRVFEICHPSNAGRPAGRGAWIRALFKKPYRSERAIIPFLDPTFVLKQARMKPTDLVRFGTDSVSQFYLGYGARQGLLPHPLFDPVFVHAHRVGLLPSSAELAEPGAFLIAELGAYLRQAGRQRSDSPSLAFDEAFLRRNRTVAKAILLRRYVNAFHAYAAHTAEMAAQPLTRTGAHAFPEAIRPNTWWKLDDALPKRRQRTDDPEAVFLAAARKRLAAEPLVPALVCIDGDLPQTVGLGQRLALVLHGHAMTPTGRIRHVELRVGRRAVTGSFQRFPRPDIAVTAGSLMIPADRMFCGFAIAWCGTAARVGPLEVAVRFKTASRGAATSTRWFAAGTIVVTPPAVKTHTGRPARVAIAMATYNPKPELFRAQIESVRNQSIVDWQLLISDESSTGATLDQIRQYVAGDRRIRVIHGGRLGFVGNFERALSQLDRRSSYFALSDQDDVWYPEKLERLIEAIEREGAALAYGDMRITSGAGHVIDESFFSWRRRHGDSTSELLLANSVTGAACLGRMSLMRHILPIPRYKSAYHDMWIALVASRMGGIAYVDGPIQDYVQHGNNVHGHSAWLDRRAAGLIQRSRQQFEKALCTAKSIPREAPYDDRPDLKVTNLLAAYWPEAIQRKFLALALEKAMTNCSSADSLGLPALRQSAEELARDLHRDEPRAFLNLPGWLKAGAQLLSRLTVRG